MAFRERSGLKRAIERSNLTVSAVAERSGVSRHTVSQLLSGCRGGSRETWARIERALGAERKP